jgi:hypothetical protein
MNLSLQKKNIIKKKNYVNLSQCLPPTVIYYPTPTRGPTGLKVIALHTCISLHRSARYYYPSLELDQRLEIRIWKVNVEGIQRRFLIERDNLGDRKRQDCCHVTECQTGIGSHSDGHARA